MIETEQVVTRLMKETFEAFHAKLKDDNYDVLSKKFIANEISMSQVLGIIQDSFKQAEMKKEVESTEKLESPVEEMVDLGESQQEIIVNKIETKNDDVIELCADDDDDVVIVEGKVSLESEPVHLSSIEHATSKPEQAVQVGPEKQPAPRARPPRKKKEETVALETDELAGAETPVIPSATQVIAPEGEAAVAMTDVSGSSRVASPSSITADSLKDKYTPEMIGYILEFLEHSKQYLTNEQYPQFVATYSIYVDKQLIDGSYDGDKRGFFCALAFGSLKHVLGTQKPTKNVYCDVKGIKATSLCRSIKRIRENGLNWD